MDELPTDTVVTIDRARMSSGNAVPYGADTAELLDVDVDELTWGLTFIAPNRFRRLQGTQLIQAEPTQNTADGGWRDAALGGDLLARPSLAPQPFDLLDNRPRRRSDDAAGMSDPASLPILHGGIDQPTCEPCAGRRLRLQRRPPASAPNLAFAVVADVHD